MAKMAAYVLGAFALVAQPPTPRVETIEPPKSDWKSPGEDHLHDVEARNGVVVSVSGPASDVGVEVLKKGGNAVDAAVATAFALAVTYPPAGNIGGGGMMLIAPPPGDGAPVAIDYRERAPAAAHATMFAKDESQYTRKAVAVPGTVSGFALAHRRYGTLPWKDLISPAIKLARDGFTINDAWLVENTNATLADSPGFAELRRVYGKSEGGSWKVGDRLTQPDLARTLEVLADQGPDAFYRGPIADAIVAEMKRGNGLITRSDLAEYRAVERKPLCARYRGRYDVFVPPPPSSGGVCLVEELNILNTFDLTTCGRWSPRTIHLMAEAMRRANCDRALYLGDPAFVDVPAYLSSPEHGLALARTIDPRKATRSLDLAKAASPMPNGENTTHFSVLDRRGMAVANTYTLERRWGSRIVVTSCGFLLNNDMWAFDHGPFPLDAKGVRRTSANAIAPGKRPLTSQTPTIVVEDGRVRLVVGTPGSLTIPHTILNILVSALDFGLPLRQAVDAPRFSHPWLPDQLSFEAPERYPDIVKPLKDMGHEVVRIGPLPQGDAHTIWVAGPNRYVGAADHRLSGKAAGF